LLTARRSLQVMVGPLAKSCNAAVSDPGDSRRASHHKQPILAIVDIRFLARLNVQAIRNTTLAAIILVEQTRQCIFFLRTYPLLGIVSNAMPNLIAPLVFGFI